MAPIKACIVCFAIDTNVISGEKAGELRAIYQQLTGRGFRWEPTYLCAWCGRRLSQVKEFRDLCLRSQQLLNDMLTKNGEITKDSISAIHSAIYSRCIKYTCHTLPSLEVNKDGFLNPDDVKTEPLSPSNGEVWLQDDGDLKMERDHRPTETEGHDHRQPGAEIINKRKRKRRGKKHKHAGNKDDSKAPEAKVQRRRTKKQLVEYLSRHYEVTHMSQEEAMLDMTRRRETASFRSAPFRCEQCARPFYRADAHRRHEREHEPGAGPLECDYCGVRATRHALLDHMRRRHRERLRCRSCGYSCAGRNLARQHLAWHNGTLYKCKVCNENFTDGVSRQLHMRGHRGPGAAGVDQRGLSVDEAKSRRRSPADGALKEKSDKKARAEIVCETCGKVFHTNWDFETHRRKHTGERPFKCDTCNKTFALKGILKIHTRTHTMERPHVCEVCGKGFAERSNMIRHTQIHSDAKSVSCDVCSKEFKNTSSLRVHVKYVHLKKPYPARRPRGTLEQPQRPAPRPPAKPITWTE